MRRGATPAPRSPYAVRWGRFSLELGRRTALMGIVNVTPDSFSDGGQFIETRAAVEHCLRLADDGADILDVGGESTRPGAPEVPADEEKRRVAARDRGGRRALRRPLSVDTRKADVARAALEAGAAMINDVTAGGDPAMLALAAERGVPVVLMHMQGSPRTMQRDPRYADVVAEVARFLGARLEAAVAAGVPAERVILDPGLGFGKRAEHNFELLARLPELARAGPAAARRPVEKIVHRRRARPGGERAAAGHRGGRGRLRARGRAPRARTRCGRHAPGLRYP